MTTKSFCKVFGNTWFFSKYKHRTPTGRQKSIKKKKDTKNSSKKSDKKVADNKKKADTKKNKDALKALSNNDKKKSSKKAVDSTSKSKKTDKKNNKKLSKKKSIDMIVKNKGSIAKNISAKKQYEMTVSEELQKVTSNKSTEQMKKPKRIVFMIFFYVAIIFAILSFIFAIAIVFLIRYIIQLRKLHRKKRATELDDEGFVYNELQKTNPEYFLDSNYKNYI